MRPCLAPRALAIERALLPVVLDGRFRGIEPGEKARDGGHRLRGRAHQVVEQDGLVHQGIETRARRSVVAESAQAVPAKGIEHHQDDVRALPAAVA